MTLLWVALIGGALGLVLGVTLPDDNKPKAVLVAFYYAAFLSVCILVCGVPATIAGTFMASTFVVAVLAIAMPENGVVKRFFKRAFE
jgi:hypothetical protein